jgi:hypothetical protein
MFIKLMFATNLCCKVDFLWQKFSLKSNQVFNRLKCLVKLIELSVKYRKYKKLNLFQFVKRKKLLN